MILKVMVMMTLIILIMLSMKSIFTQDFLQFHPVHLLLGVVLLFVTVGGNNGAGAEYHLLTNTIVLPLWPGGCW